LLQDASLCMINCR